MTKKTVPALTLIEIMVAVALIATILTAMSINMVYTQRAIVDASLRTKATDLAESCLMKFRNLRDSNNWGAFCKKINADMVWWEGNIVYYNAGGVQESARPDTFIVCNGSESVGNDALTLEPRFEIEGLKDGGFGGCQLDLPSGRQKATIRVIVRYRDFSGSEREVQVGQYFTQNNNEQAYR